MKVQLYAHPDCWLFSVEHEEDFESFGCGPGGTGDWLVPDTIYGLNVSMACKIHDWYYRFWPEDSEEARAKADRIFKNNMLRIVRAKTSNRLLLRVRKIRCNTYYLMVRKFGAGAFYEDRNTEEFMREVEV